MHFFVLELRKVKKKKTEASYSSEILKKNISDYSSFLETHSVNFLYLAILSSWHLPALKCDGHQRLLSTSSLAGHQFFLSIEKESPFKIASLPGRALGAAEHICVRRVSFQGVRAGILWFSVSRPAAPLSIHRVPWSTWAGLPWFPQGTILIRWHVCDFKGVTWGA